MNQPKKGFIPVMLTPFDESGSIDFDGLTQLTELYIEAGASGLFANCLSSEMFELSEQERLQTIRHIVEVSKGAVPVVATGSFGKSLDQQADFIKKVHDLGTEAVILLANQLADEAESESVFNERVFRLLDLTEQIPVGFYECPVPYKRLISPAQLALFTETGRVIYHKDTCLDLNQVKEKIAAVQQTNFGLYDAYMVHAVASLEAGSAGLSCIQGNYFPELIVWLCDNYNNESVKEEVALVQQFFVENMDVMHHTYPTVSKYFLQKRGLPISAFTRRVVGNFTVSHAKDMDKLFETYTQLHEEIALKTIVC